ncbi:MAG TPA: FxSxx-COOH system tetratricopeptide repeat protein [Pseudonocardia sp.]
MLSDVDGHRARSRRVFIAHTSELGRFPERHSFVAAAQDAIRRAGDLPFDMTVFTASEHRAAEVCRRAVRESDVFVLIAGFRYGSPVDDEPDLSYAELEFATAQAEGLPIYAFVLDQRTVGPVELFCDGTNCHRQRDFRERLGHSGITTVQVDSPDRLGLLLYHALVPPPGARAPQINAIPAGRMVFVGREDVLAHVHDGLVGGRIVALTGTSGIGKTSIAIEYARHRHEDRYDVRWWVRAGDPESVPAGLARLARRLDLATEWESDHAAISELRRWLSTRDRWLLVFDGVAEPEVVASYLPTGPGKILITSQSRRWDGIATTIVDVSLLDRPDSVAVLHSWMEDISDADAAQVAEELGDVPSVLDVAAGSLLTRGVSPAEFLDRLTRRTSQVRQQHRTDSEQGPATRATWAIAFDALADNDPTAMDLLTVLAWCGVEPLPLSVFDALAERADVLPPRLQPLATGARSGSLAECVRTLRGYGMVVLALDKSTVLLHRVPAGLLQARTNDPAHWHAAVVRLLRHALPFDIWENPAEWEPWRRLLPHVRAVTEQGRLLDQVTEDAAWLIDRMATYLQTTGQPREAEPLFRRAYELSRSTLGPDAPATLMCGNNLANNLLVLGRLEESAILVKDTRDRRRRTLGADDPDTFKSEKNLALVLSAVGRYSEARALDADLYERRTRRLGPEHVDTLSSAGNLGDDLRALGEFAQARGLHQRTLDRLRAILGDDHPRTLNCADQLAEDLAAAGDYQQARSVYQGTLDRRRRVQGADHPSTLTCAQNFATALLALGETAAAVDEYRDILERRRVVLGDNHSRTRDTEWALARATVALR